MYPVSEEFKKRLKQSHTAVSRVDVYNGATPLVEGLAIERGYVHADSEAANRRRCDITIGDPNMTPEQASDLLHPLSGNELHIYRGIRLHTDHLGYKGLVLNKGPVGYWRLGEKEGTTAKDASGNALHGTYLDGPELGVPGALVTDSDTAVEFDGVNDRVRIPNTASLNPASIISAEVWVYWMSKGAGTFPFIFSKGHHNQYELFAGETSNFRPWVRVFVDGTSRDLHRNAVAIQPSNTWVHIVWVFDASTGVSKLYINGALAHEATTAAGTITTTTDDLFIGNSKAITDYPFHGRLDEVSIYNHLLTADEVKEHYEAGKDQHTKHTDELVPQGVFGIEDCNVDDQGESITISVKGFDRSKRVQRARWTDLYFVAQGTNVATAIRNILTDRYPGIVIDWADTEVTTETTPPLVYGYGGWSGGGDPWEHASKLAESIGYELYFGAEGKCKLTPVPNPATDPVVWTYQEGPDNLLLFGSRTLTREEVFNHVIAFGLNTATDEPIRVEAVDDNPNSPTYINGPFGDVPTYHRSTLLLTATQAQAAAEALLRQKLGTPEQVRFISIVNPAHDIGDVVQIERERAGITGTHIIDKLAIPLGAMESMNATCRERRV